MRRATVIYLILLWVFFVSGLYIASYGVLIPYYSSTSGKDQTEYSFTFIARALAFICGSVSIKYLLRTFRAQSIMISYCGMVGASLFLCSLSCSDLNLGGMLFISGFCIISTNVIGLSMVMQLF